jgi:carboxylesterase type B
MHCTGFQIPGPHSPLYNGQYLADSQDVVVVTPKYVPRDFAANYI